MSFCHFPCGCQLCAKGAELESRLVPRTAADEKNVSVISADQKSNSCVCCRSGTWSVLL